MNNKSLKVIAQYNALQLMITTLEVNANPVIAFDDIDNEIPDELIKEISKEINKTIVSLSKKLEKLEDTYHKHGIQLPNFTKDSQLNIYGGF